MTLSDTTRSWTRFLYYLGQNPISLFGVVLTTSGAVTLIAFWLYDFLLPGPPHPYIGILLFLILPGVFALGLILIPFGIILRRRALLKSGQLLDVFPAVSLRQPFVRRTLAAIGIATFLNVIIFGTASYRGVAYMDSTQFCGQTCHTAMQPEYTAYQGSAHSHVGCVECHIGPGAGWFVRSKLSGVRQVFAVTFHTYSQPIHSPVKFLRPARETCEQCHWPQRFTGDKFLVKTTFRDDEKNTPLTTAIVVKIGGRTWQSSVGIHGRHIAAAIRYISIDDKRQVIPVVSYTDPQGKTTEFVSTDIKATPQQLAAGEHRLMDCIDCHNRPTHAFELPEPAVNKQMAAGLISPELPYIRKKAVEVLKVDYPDRDAARRQIIGQINDFYRTNYASLYNSRRSLVQQSAEGAADIYLRNVFPDMKVT
jgi:nitrate/TMAO reductase-like tetraheme cytochrome c subunit